MRPNKKPVIYWDTCIFLAWLKDEKRPNNEMEGVDSIANEIHRDRAILVTSVITQGEILQSTLDKTGEQLLVNLFKRKNCKQIAVDGRVMEVTHKIRDYYQQQSKIDELPTLTLPDAMHLASAIVYDVDEFHTFDANDIRKYPKRRALLPLNGNVADYTLKICKPPLPAQRGLSF